MRVPALFKEYIWLVNTIRKAGEDGIAFAEINEKWLETDMSEGVELARSTFNRLCTCQIMTKMSNFKPERYEYENLV